MRKKKFLAFLLFFAMVFSCIGGRSVVKAEGQYITTVGAPSIYDMTPGEKVHFKIPVKLANYNYGVEDSSSISVMVTSSDRIFETTIATLTRDNVAEGSTIGLSAYYTTNVEFDLTLKETVKIGEYKAEINFTFSGMNYMDLSPISEDTLTFRIRVKTEKEPTQLIVDNFTYEEDLAAIGSTFDISFDVKNEGEITALNTYMSIRYEGTGMIPNYSVEKIKIGDLEGGQKKNQKISVKALPDTEPGMRSLTIEFEYKNVDGVPDTPNRTVYINLLPVSTAPANDAKLVVRSTVLNAEVNTNTEYELKLEIENIGKRVARDIVAIIPESGGIGIDQGILPIYDSEGVSAGSLAAGEKKIISLPLSITKSASGLKELKVNVTYKDSEGVRQTAVGKVYITLLSGQDIEEPKNDVTISNVVQSPAQPIVGELLTLTMKVTNNGNRKISGLALYGGNVSNNGFESLTADGKTAVGDLDVGESKEVTMVFHLGDAINEGMNELTIASSYIDANGNAQNGENQLFYILNVKKVKLENDIKITNVIQSPAQPIVGELLTLNVTVANNGNRKISDLALYGENVSNNGFEPLTADGKTVVGDLDVGESKEVIMVFRLGEDIKERMNELTIASSYVDANGNAQNGESKLVYILNVKKVKLENDIKITNVVQSPAQPIAGDVLKLSFDIENNGDWDIKDLVIFGKDLSSSSFEPVTANIKTTVGDLAAGESKAVTMEFRVGSQIMPGMHELNLAVSYIDADNMAHDEETLPGIYIFNVKEVTQEQLKNSVTIGNISQSPASPVVGENVSISFTVTNNGTKEITDLKFAGSNLSSSGFEPVSSAVYTEVGSIPAGGSKNVSMTFKVGSNIPEGFNQLSLIYSYADGNGDIQNENTAVYILDVKNESSVNTSKPKLIVSDFSVDSEELRAGTTFNFTFKLKNTHTMKAAKNIKVMVTQAQDIFSATQGSNSFYIDAINPGEEAENTINLKVKSDAATGAYEIKIEVEYEYDDMSQIDANNGGVKDENLIKLQVVENARPTVQNLSIGYGWDTPTVGQATSLMFSFYNMGKSTLDNVYVTLEGDFQMESGTMQIIGSVGAGSSSWQEISIIPTTEGMASGIMVVHFEDSNGDEVTKEFEIPETYVQGEYNYGGDFYDTPPYYDPGYGVGSGDVVEPKKPLMPVWAYILCLVGALGLGTLVSRTVVVKVHKKKLMDAEDI